MEAGESSGTKQEDDHIWAKLVPCDSSCSDIDIRSNESVICSKTMCSSSEECQWCIIRKTEGSATIQNISSSVIYVNDMLIGMEECISIECGSQIIPGTDKKGLAYHFRLMSAGKQGEGIVKIPLDIEHAKCGICLSVWHDVVTVAPCLHNFCNGCLSEWMRRSQEKGQNVLCPQCRANIASVGKNHFMHIIEEAILQSAALLKRSDEEMASLDEYASIKSNVVIKGKGRKRKHSLSIGADSYAIDLPCLQCDTRLCGFKCSQSTAHLTCEACGQMMPFRPDIAVPQHCLGCERAYCGAYWQAQGVVPTRDTGICARETFRPISERSPSRVPHSAHQHNQYEIDITEHCIRQAGKTLPDVISEFIMKLSNQQIDRTTMPLSHAEMIHADTYLCNDCYDKLVGYLLYWFRISLPKYLLPPDASKREDCWYGYSCRTQHHSDEHACKRNHVCRPTRGSNF